MHYAEGIDTNLLNTIAHLFREVPEQALQKLGGVLEKHDYELALFLKNSLFIFLCLLS